MVSMRRTLWQRIRKPLVIDGIIAACIGVVLLIFVVVRFYGTGFTGKTLWDRLQLLGVLAIPVAVALGTLWFTTKQSQVSSSENKDNQRETALQAYFDKISDLLIANHLDESAGNEQIREITRLRTLTVLRRFDAERKGSVLMFLHESGLISKDKCILDLRSADLRNAYLGGANMGGTRLSSVNLSNAILNLADLHRADLSYADLSHALLSYANLSRAKLNGADLSGAVLGTANLSGAIVTPEQLDKSLSFKLKKTGITPDESKHT
jgi:uncharacterized protein YjbI with pentapeptide repeats